MRFGILGPLDISDAGERVEVRGRRRRILLIRLLTSADEVVPAARLLDDVWDDSPQPRTPSTLTSHVLALRELVGRERIETLGNGYRLRLGADDLDVARYEADVAAGRRAMQRGDPVAGLASFAKGLARWRGPALVDAIGLGWADRHAARIEESRRATIESQLAARLMLGQLDDAVAEAEGAVGDEPLRERRWAVLMLAMYRSGRQADALRTYRRLRGVLGSELGIEPSPGLARLDAAILRHEERLDDLTVDEIFATPATASAAARQAPRALEPAVPTAGWLPVPRDPLVGREKELAELPAHLTAARLVTLTGVGGIGKTRLAVEAARLIGDRFEVTAFVDLSGLDDPAQVVAAAVTALQVPVPPGVTVEEALIAVLRDASALLVVDNAEHVLGAVGRMVEAILDRCPACHVLVTSRQPLHLRGERVWQVAALEAASAGADLFEARLGRAADRDRTVELCRRLDGIPLAIELAAATCRTVGVADLVERLDARLDLLLGARPQDGRHASLRATLAWSHDLLGTAERQLLRRLTVFAGSFTLRAVESICAPLDSPLPTAAVLTALVDTSLVVFDPATTRYRLLETVRLFAAEQLDAGDEVDVRDAHARWHLDELLAQPWVDVTTLQPFAPEAPNLLAAADWCTRQERHRDAVVLLTRSAGVWVGSMQETHVATRALAAYQQCHDQLTTAEDAIACALFGMALPKGRAWRRRGLDRDPELACLAARSNAVALALGDADHRPADTIATLNALRALPGGLDPDTRILSCVAEAQARCRLDDLDGAEAVYTALIDDRSSMFWAGPMLALAAIRALKGDTVGADELLALVDQHPARQLRLGPHTARAVRAQVDIARGDLDAAGLGLRRLAALRDRYDSSHRSIDHLWFETAALLAAARGEIGRAAHLADAADRTLGDGESSPFVTWMLRRRHGLDPAWLAARAEPVGLLDAARLAALVARE